MKHTRILLLLLLLLALAIPAGAAFSDVPENAWYYDAVALCEARGLMSGTGDGQFSPDQHLTQAELVVLSARLHELLRGGDGNLPAAPEGYRTVTVTAKDGTPAPFDITGRDGGIYYTLGTETTRNLQFQDNSVLKLGDEYTVTLILDKTYQTTAKVGPLEGKDGLWLTMENPTGFPSYMRFDNALFMCGKAADIPAWAMSAVYYLDTHDDLWTNADLATDKSSLAYRRTFAELLTQIVPASTLAPVLNEVPFVPDLGPRMPNAGYQEKKLPDVLDFYRAGIFTGSDEAGTFYGYRTLKRGEVATTLARIVEPTLRQSFTLKTPEQFLQYDLTPVSEGMARLLKEKETKAITALVGDQLILGSGPLYSYYDNQGKEYKPATDNVIRLYPAADTRKLNMSSDSVTHQLGYDTTLAAPVWEGFAPYSSALQYGWGLASANGVPVTAPVFQYCGNLAGGKAIVQLSDESWHILTVK